MLLKGCQEGKGTTRLVEVKCRLPEVMKRTTRDNDVQRCILQGL